MPDKVIPVPDPGDPDQDRTVAERHVRLICHMGLGGGSYAFDIWGRVSTIKAVPAKVLPFPRGPLLKEGEQGLAFGGQKSDVCHDRPQRGTRRNAMTTFTINEQNEIVAFGSAEQAAAASTTPFDTFTSEQEFAALASTWPGARLVALWNTLPGVTPVHKFTNHRTAIRRIWARIQNLGTSSPPHGKAVGGAGLAQGAPVQGKATQKASSAKRTAKTKRSRRPVQPTAPRQGSKAAQVIALLQRKNGATLSEIMKKMSWQPHTVRGFMAGAMKKAGYAVESFKPEGGERSYKLAR
jgi:hypothetical protein